MLGKIEGRRRKGMTEDEMVGWHHRLNGHESEQTPGDREGQGSLACCSPWGRRESDTTEQLNKKEEGRGEERVKSDPQMMVSSHSLSSGRRFGASSLSSLPRNPNHVDYKRPTEK